MFSGTVLLGAGLLFLLEPMCAKMVLPLLGGSPGVWNTCMVFFQAGLLAGYAYAHAGPRYLGIRGHAALHLCLLLVPFLFLPMALGQEPPQPADSPVLWLLRALLLSAGLPFVMLASTAPLSQRWFASAAPQRDPYFLYAASNLGSMAALLSYPLLVEPNFTLTGQSLLWTVGYGVLAFLSFICGAFVVRSPRAVVNSDDGSLTTVRLASGPSPLERLSWLLLALLPSSLMLSVTNFLTTDIAAIPLFWVVPLAIYLLTFILVFAGKPVLPHGVFLRWLPLVVLALVVIKLIEATQPAGIILGIHLLGLFWICMACHGELARRRPASQYLTEYYLWLALGGVLGGMFNALLAPIIFTSVTEYPIMLVAACLLLPRRAQHREETQPGRLHHERRPLVLDFVFPLLVGAATVGLLLVARRLSAGSRDSLLANHQISVALTFALPLVIGYTFLERPLRFGLGIGAILLASTFSPGVHGRVIYHARSFFGVHKVTEDGGFRKLVHGNTVHGMQNLDPAESKYPLTYYHVHGPIGRLLTHLEGDPRLKRVGLIGLGTGALAYYAKPGMQWTFFEIDPEVIRIASPGQRLFTYLQDAEGQVGPPVVGDGRLALAQSRASFGLIVVDAFNSDAIPVHLLTREALQTYRSRLTPDGILAIHFSNNYLDLEPVLANLAHDAEPPLECLVWNDRSIPEEEKRQGRMPAQWAVLAGADANLQSIRTPGSGWQPGRRDPRLRVWTDDFSNLLQVFQWTEPRD